MGVVVLQNVWKKYGDVEAVKNLNLECKEGEFLALLGPSGCGKSSTLRMIAGLERITLGSIFIDGREVNALEPRQRDIAMAFEAYALYPHLTAYENIAFPLRVRGMREQEVDRRVREIADTLDIGNILDRLPRHLSGGQQQRISFARAMVRPARVYLMDEPLSHLDAKQRSQLRSELKRLHRFKGLTIVFVTHDQIEAMAMADRIAVMNLGVLQQVGTPLEVFNHPKNLFVANFVGEPPINLLSVTVRQEGQDILFTGDGFMIAMRDGRLAAAAAKLSTSKGVLGIRPMHIALHRESVSPHSIPGNVTLYEGLGDTAVVTVQVGGNAVRVETSPDVSVSIGERVFLQFSAAHVHLFDQDTGENLLH
ncbi:MAG: ABC transporter ATP-binding protein [Bacillota bacterium]|nr:ABC transporter ATP-binding protein [Bacillota bacterium]